MAIDIFNTKSGDDEINNGSVVYSLGCGYQVDDSQAVHTPTIDEIEDKYDGKFAE